RSRGKERLLNLKDLLPVLQPSFMCIFENGPILRPHFLCRIVPNSAIFCQNVAEYGTKSTFFASGFCENGRGPAAREPSQGAPNTNWLAGRKHPPERPTVFAGRGSQDLTSGSLVGY